MSEPPLWRGGIQFVQGRDPLRCVGIAHVADQNTVFREETLPAVSETSVEGRNTVSESRNRVCCVGTAPVQAGANSRLLFNFAPNIINSHTETQYILKGWKPAEARIK